MYDDNTSAAHNTPILARGRIAIALTMLGGLAVLAFLAYGIAGAAVVCVFANGIWRSCR